MSEVLEVVKKRREQSEPMTVLRKCPPIKFRGRAMRASGMAKTTNPLEPSAATIAPCVRISKKNRIIPMVRKARKLWKR